MNETVATESDLHVPQVNVSEESKTVDFLPRKSDRPKRNIVKPSRFNDYIC